MRRIGVTGHRAFDDVARVAGEVDAVLVGLRDGGDVEIWSSLAEGADRLVAERAMQHGAALTAVLPLPADDHRTDFAGPSSVAEFERLLGAAADVRVVRPSEGTREAAYEAAGLAMLAGIDVLVAVWDGAPSRGRGGTAEIVAEARRRGIEVVVVPVTRANV